MKIKIANKFCTCALLINQILTSQLAAAEEPSLTSSQFELAQLTTDSGEVITDWIANTQAFVIALKRTGNKANKSYTVPSNNHNEPSSNYAIQTIPQFQVLLGDTDISSLIQFDQQNLFFKGGLPLPPGEHQLSVNQLINDQWVLIGTSILQVLSSGGFQQAEWQPRLDLNINSQLDEEVSGDAPKSERPQYTDVDASIGLTSRHQGNDFSIDTALNLIAVSNREQAVQFGTKGVNAKKLDITDYNLSFIKGNHQLNIGHTSYGNNPLLIDNLSRRGVSWQYQNEQQLTLNGAILSGTDIVGYNNILGLANYSNEYVNSLGFGLNLFAEQRISLRLEGSLLDAERISQNDFGVSEISSAEKNSGAGLRLVASDNEGRFEADLVVGLSRYTNPEDSALSLGEPLVKLQSENSIAHNLSVNYLLMRDGETPWGSVANITLLANHSSADPLYQTLTAFVQANIENSMLGAQYQLGHLSGNLSLQASRDNLDNLKNLLTTKTKTDNFSLNIPIAAYWLEDKESEPNPWLPNLDYNYQQSHQFALNSPNTDDSGFNDNSHLPDQLTTSHNIASSWQIDQHSFSFQSSYSQQDNRQLGRELSDFSNLQHAASLNLQQNESSAWIFTISKNRQADIENAKVQWSEAISVSYSWQSIDGLAFAIAYGLSKEHDNLDESESLATTADISLIKNLTEGEWWLPAQGSISLRVNYNDSESIDNVFDQRNQFGTTTAQLGISLSF